MKKLFLLFIMLLLLCNGDILAEKTKTYCYIRPHPICGANYRVPERTQQSLFVLSYEYNTFYLLFTDILSDVNNIIKESDVNPDLKDKMLDGVSVANASAKLWNTKKNVYNE